ncbi:hypothetical protein BDP27DRAFT_1333399 [Rhodocollybia butyracea]|uniref:Acetyl-CoA synthetase-like protein n=1 Tax=Rhodocollybia butyracea TaxID=206335 RepID=A0A9P5PM60_9AGAR|nr:hypothetical protein BDP27DRAFT_1333399 [Rhodocollybia butyracea]
MNVSEYTMDRLGGTEYFSSTFAEIPNLPEVSTWSFIFERVNDFAAHKLFVDAKSKESLTFSEVHAASRSLAYTLRHKLGLVPGDTVVVVSSNSIFLPVTILATQAAGLICSPANSLAHKSELSYQILDCGAKALLCGPEHIWDLCQSNLLLDPPSISPSEAKALTCLLCYSSGSMQKIKYLLLWYRTHYNITSAIIQAMVLAPSSYKYGETWLATVPITHIYGLFNNVFMAPHVGVTVVIMERFILDDFTENLQTYNITASHIVPPIAVRLSKNLSTDFPSLPSLKEWRSAGAPIGYDLTKLLETKSQVQLQGLYGMTETTAIIALTDRDRGNTPLGTVGRLAPNLQAKLVNGELCLKGPNITPGYHNRPDVNAEAFDNEGYMRTGDIVYIDKEGFLYIVDRVKELIKYNGYQVYPIEDILLDHKLVKDAALVGLNDLMNCTELPLAYVVLDASHVTEASSLENMAKMLRDYIASKAAPYKKLRGGIIFVHSIPKSPSGKIMRRQLKDFANGQKHCLPNLEVIGSFTTLV